MERHYVTVTLCLKTIPVIFGHSLCENSEEKRVPETD